MLFGGAPDDFSLDQLKAFHHTSMMRDGTETRIKNSPYTVSLETVLLARLNDVTLAANAKDPQKIKEKDTIVYGFLRETQAKIAREAAIHEKMKLKWLERQEEFSAKAVEKEEKE